MKLDTSILKNMLSAASRCKPSKLLEITNYYELDFSVEGISLRATDGVNFITINHPMKCDEDMSVIVKADQFSKLINKTTKDTVGLKLMDNYLEVKGNGTYKVEIVSDEVYPTLDIDADKEFMITYTTLSNAIVDGAKAKSASPNDGVLYSYLLRDNQIITADAIKVYSTELDGEYLDDMELLIPPTLATLLQSIDTEKVIFTVNKDCTLLRAVGQNVTITGALQEGASEYPNVIPLLNSEYPHTCEVNVKEVLQAVDRLNLFLGLYDKGIIDLVFSDSNMTIATSSKSVEVIEYTKGIDLPEPFMISVNGVYLKDLFSAVEEPNVTIQFGTDETIKLCTMDSIMMLATADEE
jgi:DNA polymerase III sliding clamp (beta) subunit (PCNA family)|nr:MAG TPA: beta clamp protein [Caudoviricetes sp.]